MKERKTNPRGLLRLEELVKKYGTVKPDGIALDLSKDPARWDRVIRDLGRKQAYAHIGKSLCREYRRQNGRDFLFTEECVAYEIGWHINAYLWTQGFKGYPRHVLTYAFSKEALDRHCRTVEVDEKDLHDLRQRLVFHYKKGLRKSRSAAEVRPETK